MELTQGMKEQLIGRITELMDENILKVPDWCLIYDVMLEVCEREKALSMENYLKTCLDVSAPSDGETGSEEFS